MVDKETFIKYSGIQEPYVTNIFSSSEQHISWHMPSGAGVVIPEPKPGPEPEPTIGYTLKYDISDISDIYNILWAFPNEDYTSGNLYLCFADGSENDIFTMFDCEGIGHYTETDEDGSLYSIYGVKLPESITQYYDFNEYVWACDDDKLAELFSQYFKQYTVNVDYTDNLEEINGQVFAWTDVTEIMLPDTVTYIYADAFEDSKLETLYIGDAVYVSTESIEYDDWYFNGGYKRNKHINKIITVFDTDCYITSIIEEETSTYTNLSTIDDYYIGNVGTNHNKVYKKIIYVDELDSTKEILQIREVRTNVEITDLVLPESKTTLTSREFIYCTELNSVVVNDNIASISDYCFSNCTSLTSVTLGNSVTTIGQNAFYNCKNLESINIPESVTTIGQFAFSSTKLSDVVISDNVTSIGQQAFTYCTSLTNITLGNGITDIPNFMCMGCSSLTSITIPDSVTSIGQQAFIGCTGLTDATIGHNVTSIGSSAFNQCTSLTNFSYNGTMEEWKNVTLPSNTWCYNINTPVLHCTDGDIYLVNYILAYNNSGTYTTKYSDTADIKNLTMVTTTNKLTRIYDYTFQNATSLSMVYLDDALVDIGTGAFYQCTNLTKVEFGIGLTSIGASAFYGCYNIVDLSYAGTKEQWNAIEKGANWHYNIAADKVFCSDGWVDL